MLSFLNGCSKGRGAWFLLALSVIIFEGVALYFQHVMLLRPCVLCIYERCALFGILGAALIGMIAPSSTVLRYLAIIVWIYSAIEGVLLTWKHTMMQLYPSPMNVCDFFVSFPSWLPLDKWIPSVFVANGDCSEKQWSFLSMEMPQWLLIIFGVYLLIALLVVLAQFVKPKRRYFS
ncbi:disulfide bond formation protein B [Leminorella grimontii]|uniref:Disulfide bond formation protein B n=1 Tax=Leminorella grimontii TaxID=82981 RepID=A0AAV5MY66_9GAMM|nr:disulfide bond formation protein DsbB [Leminorella grimontii]KFC96032.1 periplasmic thiol:disulfide oxidoreductase [Leminorella grimontii ATCC 33999 = DSM 5078]GKX54786.1 disulfide bond formation protein B [Leminorella grimontii]VFS58447.1 Disulfide oxidoreductase [Leminorella grimontii]